LKPNFSVTLSFYAN